MYMSLLTGRNPPTFAKDTVYRFMKMIQINWIRFTTILASRIIKDATVASYLIYVGMLIVVHGGIASLNGLGASVQTFWFECVHNLSIGSALLIVFFCGLAGALVMANIVMLLSIKIKNTKITTVLGIVVLVLMYRQASTYSQIKMFNPLQFKESVLLTDFLFVGNTVVPYFVIALLLSAAYIFICWLLLRFSYKKYQLN